jgi:tetratricopeptide (TPR) repeat protein
LRYVSVILTLTGDLDGAAQLDRAVLATCRELGNEMHVAYVLNGTGYKALLAGEYDEAIAALEESLEIARRLRLSSVRMVLGNLGLVAVFQGRYRDAVSMFDEGLQQAVATGDRRIGSEAVLGLAAAHAAFGDYDLAVRLEAIAKTEYEAIGVVESAEVLDRLEPLLRKAREQANPLSVEDLIGRGRPLTMDTAVAELECHASKTTSPAWPPSALAPLNSTGSASPTRTGAR